MKIMNVNHTRTPILVALLTLIIVSAMSYSSYIGRDFAVRYAPLIDAAMEIKLEATTAHLWFEELMSGDRVVRIEDIWKHIDQSRWYAQAMLEGGENEEGHFVPLQDPILRKNIKQTIEGIDTFRDIALQRWEVQSNSGVGSDIDQRFDKAFEDFIASADNVETALQKAMGEQLQQYKIEQYLLILLIIIIGILIGGILYRYDRQRINDIVLLQNKEENLRITLNSIGDAVIVTDNLGKITRMNPKAINLTGWTETQAIGLDLALVFNIFHAITNEVANNPVAEALKTRRVVELANHTVLLSKTGERFHISDSAAPIFRTKNKSEDILGVILVFQDVTRQYQLREDLENNQQVLLEERAVLRGIINSTPDLIFCKDPEGLYLRCNEAFEHFFDAPESEIKGKTDYDFVPPEMAEFFRNKDKSMLKTNSPQINEEAVIYPDGSEILLETLKTPLKNAAGNTLGILGISRNITQQRQSEDRLRITGQVFDSSNEGIFVTDLDNNIIEINHAFSKITGYCKDEVIGKSPRLLSSGLQSADFYKQLWQAVNTGGSWSGEILNRRKNGETYHQSLSISTIKNEQGEIQKHIAVMADINESKKAQEHIQFLAQHDVLTGLPNRALLTDRLQQAILTAERNSLHVAILYLDLDRFKFVNDSLGHDTGDALLIEVANRLTTKVREEDTVARTGGDEFTILLLSSDAQGAAHVAKNLIDSISEPFKINDHELYVTLSVGISLYPENGDNGQTLRQKADTAMYRAKNSGRGQYQFFTEEMQTEMLRRIELENALRFALERNQFALVYQPQVDISTSKIIGCEALIRWKHSEKGYISPVDFIPIAEETGLINTVGDWVLSTATQQLKQWISRGYPDFVMAVNISGVQFSDPKLVTNIENHLKRHDIPAHNLEIEITESIAMKDIELTLKQLNEISTLGVLISLDDFGTGYSSLSYLKKFPINKLKIDQSFIFDMLKDKDSESIVDTVISLAKSLGLESIAEGVETKEHMDSLKSKGCNQIQGYYFSKPIPAEQFIQLLES